MIDYKNAVITLNEIGVALSSEKDINKLLVLIVEKIIDFIHCDACSLFLREYEPDRLLFKVAKTVSLDKKGEGSLIMKEAPVPLSKEFISSYCAITGETVNIPDCYNIPEEKEYHFGDTYDKRTGYKTVSMLCVPMKNNKGKIIGVLQLLNNFDKNKNIVPFPSEFETMFESLASQAGVAIENASLLEANKNLYRALVRAFSEAIEERSPHTAGHSKRVAYISMLLVNAINEDSEYFPEASFSNIEIEELRYAALLHDVGKVAVPERILEKNSKLDKERLDLIRQRYDSVAFYLSSIEQDLEKREKLLKELASDLHFVLDKSLPGRPLMGEDKERMISLTQKSYKNFKGEEIPYITEEEAQVLITARGTFTPAEYEKMKMHVVYTNDILKQIPFTEELKNLPLYAASHHEMLDGSGYPKGLESTELPLQSRILAVADIFEALTASDRPYKKAMSIDLTLKIMGEEVERGRLDKNLVDLFIEKGIYKIYLEKRDNPEV